MGYTGDIKHVCSEKQGPAVGYKFTTESIGFMSLRLRHRRIGTAACGDRVFWRYGSGSWSGGPLPTGRAAISD